jgi:hypothetical protein
MQEVALVYFVIAWLACWMVDLVIIVARGPVMIDPILKLIIVLICLVIVLIRLSRHGWLLGG